MSAGDELLERFRTHAATLLGVEPDQVTPEARLVEDLDADSLDLVEIVLGLEEDYGFVIDEADLQGVETVGQAVAVVRRKLPD